MFNVFESSFSKINNLFRNHVKFAIESGDVKLTEGLPNQRVDTGHSCTKTAEARGVTITAEMVNDNDELDSMAINYFEMTKLAFLSGKISHLSPYIFHCFS